MNGKTRRLATVLTTALCAGTLRAQSVPLITADFTVGYGATSSSAGALFFCSTSRAIAVADAAIRLGGPGRLRPVLEVGYSSDVLVGDVTTICLLAPNGSCRILFPRTSGPSIGIGARFAPTNRWLLGITAGVASFDSQARYAKLDVSWRVVQHVAIATNYRYLDVASGGDRAWFRPWTFGVRVN